MSQSYKVRRVPETPSASLNSMLMSRCSEPTSSVVQYVIGSVVCGFYEAATTVHHGLLRIRADIDAKIVWMAACGLVGLAIAIAAWLVFSVLMASSFIIYGILHYAAVVTGVVGIGLGAAGALYFSKDMQSSKHGASGGGGGVGSREYHYHSTVTTSHEHHRSHDD